MKFARSHETATARHPRNRLYRYAALAFAAFFIAGCSAQPMTLNQELVAGAVAGGVGAGVGALFAASASKSYPVSMLIGAAGMAGIILLYEEIKREAAEQSNPNPPPVPSNPPETTTPSTQNP
jgi:hypothetical protein